MDGGNLRVHVALVVRTLHAEGQASATKEAVCIKAVVGAVVKGKLFCIYIGVRGFDLGFHKEVVHHVKSPTKFTRETQSEVVHSALVDAVNVHVSLGRSHTGNHVNKLAVFT